MVDFHKTRAIAKVNTAWVKGVQLEELPVKNNGEIPGMVLIHRDWKEFYLVRERSGWEEGDYFEFALSRFNTLDIKHP